MCALYLPLAKSHVQFPFLTIFKRISPNPRFCEILLNAVSCYVVELLGSRPTTKPEDAPCQISAVVCSVYYKLPYIRRRHLIHRNLRACRIVLTWTHLVRLMIDPNYLHIYHHHHHLIFSVAVKIILKTLIE